MVDTCAKNAASQFLLQLQLPVGRLSEPVKTLGIRTY